MQLLSLTARNWYRGRLPALTLGLVLLVGWTDVSAAQERPLLLHLHKMLKQPLSAACHATIRPELVVIAGGVRAEGIKATAVDASLEKSVAELRESVQQRGGEFLLTDRLRSFREPGDNSRAAKAKAPFIGYQGFQIQLDASTAIDPLLDELVRRGANHFGPGNRRRTESMYVSYTWRERDAVVQSVFDDCRAQAFAQVCKQAVPASMASDCVEQLRNIDGFLVTRSYRMQAQTTLPSGQSSRIALPMPTQIRPDLELVVASANQVELHGEISLYLEQP